MSNSYSNQPPAQLTQRLSIWCLFCLANLCELDQRFHRIFLHCPVCNEPRHSFTIRINPATQQALIHPNYHEHAQFASVHPINAEPRRSVTPVPVQAPGFGPDFYPDPHYQSPYGDHPEIYRTSPTGYGTVRSEYIGYPSAFSSAQPTPQEPIYGKLVPAEFRDTPHGKTPPLRSTAGHYAGVAKPAQKKRARPSKTLEGAAKQAALVAAGLKEGVKDGAGNRVVAWPEGVEDAEAGFKNEQQALEKKNGL